MMFPSHGEQYKAHLEATVDLQMQIEQDIKKTHPQVKQVGDPVYRDFKDGKITICSLDLSTSDLSTRQSVFAIALQRGHDSSLKMREHGAAGHVVFDRVLDEVAEDLRIGTAEFEMQQVAEKKGSATSRMVPAYLLKGPKRETEVFIPNSHALAKEIGEKGGRKFLVKTLKQRIRSGEISPANALLTLFYSRLDESAVLEILSESDFRRAMATGETNIRLPHKSDRDEGISFLGKIIWILGAGKKDFTTVSSIENHREALQFVAQQLRLPVSSEDQVPLHYSEIFTPLVVFKGLVGQAFKVAARITPSFRDPALTNYVYDKFGGYCTTEIVTAYEKTENQASTSKIPGGSNSIR